MNILNDIKSKIEGDVKRLTEAMLTGEVSINGISLADEFSEDLIHQFSASIIRYQLENRLLSTIIPYLASMRWLTLPEACIYSRRSRNTLLLWLECGKIYGTKPEGSGDYIIDRESIDKYFNILKDEREIHLSKIRRVR